VLRRIGKSCSIAAGGFEGRLKGTPKIDRKLVILVSRCTSYLARVPQVRLAKDKEPGLFFSLNPSSQIDNEGTNTTAS